MAESKISSEEKLLRTLFGVTTESSSAPSGGSPRPVLRVHMAGGPTLSEMIAGLTDLQRAYAGVDLFLTTSPDQSILPTTLLYDVPISPLTDLVIRGARFKSPGWFDFLGTLNPLKVLTDYVQQRHERKKDHSYRNRAEAERLALENASLKNRVVSERISILRQAGVTDEQIQRLLNVYFAAPLGRLGQHLDSGLIDGAELRTESDGEHGIDE